MNVTEAIAARRSTRAFTPEKPSDPVVRALLEAAVQAPSAMNTQPWSFAVVQDAAQLERYSDGAKLLLLERQPRTKKTSRYAELLASKDFNVFYDATTLVVIGVEEPNDYSQADCWLAAANLMLAATEAKLGTCCIGFAIPLLNTGDVKRELGFGPRALIAAPIIVGTPSVVPAPVPRFDPRVVSWSR